MNDDTRLERLFADGLHGTAPTRAPESLRTQIKQTTGQVRPRPRWLALIKEPPMRISAHVAVGSPTARVAAILAATLLIALSIAAAGVAGSRLLAADGTITVAQDGSGTFTSIAEAVAMAEDGDTILVRPGRYVEGVAIVGKDVSLIGDGARDEVIIEATDAVSQLPEELAPDPGETWALLLMDTDSTVSNLTVLGAEPGSAIDVIGPDAAPMMDGLVVRQLGSIALTNSIWWAEGAAGVLQNSTVEGFISIDGSPELRSNEMPRTCIDVQPDSDAETYPIIHGNTIHGCPQEYLIWVEDAGASIVGNDLMSEPAADSEPDASSEGGRTAIILFGTAADVVVSDNDIHDSLIGIRAVAGATASLEGNRLVDNTLGFSIAADGVEVRGNTVSGGQTGIGVVGGAPTLTENEVSGAANRGISLSGGTSATLTGNVSCDNSENLNIAETAEPTLVDNEICEDVPTE